MSGNLVTSKSQQSWSGVLRHLQMSGRLPWRTVARRGDIQRAPGGPWKEGMIGRSRTNLEMAWQATKVKSCWNFSWQTHALICQVSADRHTPWSVRLCNRNSKSAKSSFRSKKRKIKICSIKHGSFRQVWCECNSEYLPSEMQKKNTLLYTLRKLNLARCRNI